MQKSRKLQISEKTQFPEICINRPKLLLISTSNSKEERRKILISTKITVWM